MGLVEERFLMTHNSCVVAPRRGRFVLLFLGFCMVVLSIWGLVLNLAPARAVPADIDVQKEIAANMVRVPGGRYMMWAEPSMRGKESGHWVEIKPFLISKFEVTQRVYQAVMGDNPSNFKGDPDLPVEQVSWSDCLEFIKRLNAIEGKEVYRLPTEAEWEYACLAGSTDEKGASEIEKELDSYAWHRKNSEQRTHPVGQLKPNGWGLYDMLGNVWEWCQDWHGEYAPGTVTAPEGVPTGFRVLRGGAWDSPAGDCRTYLRRSYSPSRERLSSFGFRLAATIFETDK